MDVLADILDATGLTGRVFCQRSVRAPWGLRLEPGPHARVHVVAQGGGWLVAADGDPERLGAGDVVLLPHGTGHALCDDLSSPQESLDAWRARARTSRFTPGGRAVTRLVCGTYALDSSSPHPVLQLLPRVIRVSGDEASRHPGLQATLGQLVRELEAPDVGSEKIVSRLLDVLFIQILRFWIDTREDGATGWLGALRDRSVGRALVLVHKFPGRPWTVRSLAAAAGLSRPVFARRFVERVGQPPLAYVVGVRMDLAARLLRTTDTPLAQIAETVGYASEFAFNRAFRRLKGVPPGRFRRGTPG